MDNQKEESRYFPDERELQILISQLKVYFSHRERSSDRKRVCLETCKLLQKEKGGNHWTERSTRLWFNNNKTNYLSNNPPRISTALIQPIQAIDPNLAHLNSIEEQPTQQKSVIFNINTISANNSFSNSNSNPILTSNLTSNSTSSSISNSNISTSPNNNSSIGENFFSLNSQSVNSNLPDNLNTNISNSSLFPSDPAQSFINSPKNPYPNYSSDESQSSFFSRPPSTSSDNRICPYSSSISRSDTPEILRESITITDFEVPPLPKVNLVEYDPMKHQHYQYLQFLYNLLRDISSLPPEKRHEKQIQVEKAFGDCLQQFHSTLGISRVISNDPTAKKTIQALQPTNITLESPPRYPSITSSIYAGIRSPPKTTSHIMTSPNVYFPSTVHVIDASPSLLSLFRGESQATTFPLSDQLSSPSAFCFDENGILYYTSISEGAFYLHALGSDSTIYPKDKINTRFFTPPIDIIADNSTVWVAGDCRIFGFNKQTFEKIDVLYISNHICPSFSLALSNDNLICASNGFIYLFETFDSDSEKEINLNSKISKNSKSSSNNNNVNNNVNNKENKRIALENGIKDVDWTNGRQCIEKIAVLDEVKDDTKVIQVGNYFCVSSSNHHAIHVIDKDKKETVARLVGHTAGITVLSKNDNSEQSSERLLSGSDDLTIREWELENMRIEKVFAGYGESIQTITTGEWEGASLLFSSDGYLIRAWSEDYDLPLFEVRLVNKKALGLKFIPSQKALLALCMKENNSPSDAQKNVFSLLRYDFQ